MMQAYGMTLLRSTALFFLGFVLGALAFSFAWRYLIPGALTSATPVLLPQPQVPAQNATSSPENASSTLPTATSSASVQTGSTTVQ